MQRHMHTHMQSHMNLQMRTHANSHATHTYGHAHTYGHTHVDSFNLCIQFKTFIELHFELSSKMEQVVELPSIDEVLSYMVKMGDPIHETTRFRIEGTLGAYTQIPPPGNKPVTPGMVVEMLRRTASHRRMASHMREGGLRNDQLTRCMQHFQKKSWTSS